MGRRRLEPTRHRAEKRRVTRRTFLEEFARRLRETVTRHLHRTEERETLRHRIIVTLGRKMREIVESRGRALFRIPVEFFHPKKWQALNQDKIALSLPPEDLQNIINILRQGSMGKGIPQFLIEQIPELRWFLWHYMAYYSKYPCKHNIFAVKITPVTRYHLQGTRMVFYLLRYARAKDIKADPYLGRGKNTDLIFTFMRYKYDGDFWNSLLEALEGTGDMNDTVALARDSFRNVSMQAPLRRVILQPHWVKWGFAKEAGKPEAFYLVGHCSLYAVVGRVTKSACLYRGEVYRPIIGKRPRHRIKEMLYYRGVRI